MPDETCLSRVSTVSLVVVSYEARVEIAGASSDLPECWSLYFIVQCSAMTAFSFVNCQSPADGSVVHSVDIIFFYLFNSRRASSSPPAGNNNGCPIFTPFLLRTVYLPQSLLFESQFVIYVHTAVGLQNQVRKLDSKTGGGESLGVAENPLRP